MTINKNHRLIFNDSQDVNYVQSPNHGGIITPEYLVIHFTAGRDLSSSVKWLTNPRSRASAHLVIGRDGTVTQLIPFNIKAWHAGKSSWRNRVGLNNYSIGIELDNAGRLTQSNNGKWYAWFGKVYPSSEVILAIHKNETVTSAWHKYTDKQLEVALEITQLLVEHYSLQDVVGHDDISQKRKIDPGPAFPMDNFHSRKIV
ncbi:MAG: N-acetylmuramoyl-L-alanine amidase [Spirochaetota bacterium]|nr:N-acetylmuramoyl-L-alanine amidase [Spirochaetota bacterium]